ncbi:conserved protein of unknown function [Magnetospirillum sp. XM-1]|uniref:DUF6441 family protein n=1 Tax=Magnetospirillum sp. XM-1 TaxID=1663591 RepID=UPI00073DC66F|nr:DUF6441 family protein [Magnetospirillum sp. XM-1]CUW39677.1 conserved protein of unknown function [Magnetospirillum sp. XM-1]
MRLGAAILGSLPAIVREEMNAAERAAQAALREAGTGLRDDLRQHVADAGLGKLSRAWAVRVYRGSSPLSGAAFVYVKGRSAAKAMWAFENGAIIRATHGRYLAIPTGFNMRGGRRGGKMIYRPQDLRDTFVQRSKKGNLLLFARVAHAQRQVKGRVRDLAFVEKQMLGSGRVRRTEAILQAGAVPMFLLVPQITIKKRLNVGRVVPFWEDRLPELLVQHWEAANGR